MFSDQDTVKKINKARPLILLYEGDEDLKNGVVVFYPSSKEIAADKPFNFDEHISSLPSMINNSYYALIEKDISLVYFKSLIEKFFNGYDRVLFYCTNFSNKHMEVLKNQMQAKYEPFIKSFQVQFCDNINQFYENKIDNTKNIVSYIAVSNQDLLLMASKLLERKEFSSSIQFSKEELLYSENKRENEKLNICETMKSQIKKYKEVEKNVVSSNLNEVIVPSSLPKTSKESTEKGL